MKKTAKQNEERRPALAPRDEASGAPNDEGQRAPAFAPRSEPNDNEQTEEE